MRVIGSVVQKKQTHLLMLQNEFKEDAPTEDLPTSNDAETDKKENTEKRRADEATKESNRQQMGHEGCESEE